MKKFLKTSFICLVIFVMFICVTQVYAALGEGLNDTIKNKVTANNSTLADKFSNPLNNIFGTLFFTLKVLGVAGIVINGVRYMYADSQDKAKIKQSLVYIIIGTIFIFGAEIVVNFIKSSLTKIKIYKKETTLFKKAKIYGILYI